MFSRRLKLAIKVIMPALGMAQETGKLVSWLKQEGELVSKGEAIMEIETDKATVEIEATATGVLSGVSAQEGEEIPVGSIIAWILAPGEELPKTVSTLQAKPDQTAALEEVHPINVSPVAQKVATEHGIDLTKVKTDGRRIKKADVLALIEQEQLSPIRARLTPASPQARRLAKERSIDITSIIGSGPDGAVITTDILSTETSPRQVGETIPVNTIWGIMADRVTKSWTEAPHFYLMREVNAERLIDWRQGLLERSAIKFTYTDLIIRLLATALKQHPRVNTSWEKDKIRINQEINIGLAVAIENGLIVPVIHQANQLTLQQIAERRLDIINRAQNNKLLPADLQNGTFTFSNLGMYGVDAFIPIINPPQAAILAVGRIMKRVVPVKDQPTVQSRIMLTISFDHRAVDGARGAEFLDTLANLIEEPTRLII